MDEHDPALQQRVRSLIEQAQTAAQAGQRELARRYLQAALDIDPDNVDAWLWLAGVQDDLRETKRCLERVLELDPNNVQAQQGLRWAEAQLAEMGVADQAEPEPTHSRSIHQELRAHLHEPFSSVEEEDEIPALMGETAPATESRLRLLLNEEVIYRSLTLALAGLLLIGIVLLTLLMVGVIPSSG